MALRVLLADESSTIKKVIKLALQDFSVEVKAVHSGLDALEVAKQFKPDLIFADILLQKRNGYEVCADIKGDPEISATPVILMWSSFMDLDEKAFKRSMADARLEKPFEVEDLRKLVSDLVPKTQTQKVGAFLKFPSNINQSVKQEEQVKRDSANAERTGVFSPPPPPPPSGPMSDAFRPDTITGFKPTKVSPPPKAPVNPAPPPLDLANELKTNAGSKTQKWNMESFEDINEFSEQEPLSLEEPAEPHEGFQELRLGGQEQTAPWNKSELEEFKVNTSDEADPFALMDLNKAVAGLTEREPETQSRKRNDQSPGSFSLPDGDELDLQLEEVQQPVHDDSLPPAPQEASNWNFEVPEAARTDLQVDARALTREVAPPQNDESEDLGQANERTAHMDLRSNPALAPDAIENIVREQVRDIVEQIVRKILPELAKSAIQAELDRLLGEEPHP